MQLTLWIIHFTEVLHIALADYWIGEGPRCTGRLQGCKTWDMKEVAYDRNTCSINGERVLCAIKKSTYPHPNPDPVIKVLSYNVNILPYKEGLQGQVERLCRIPRIISSRYHVVDVVQIRGLFHTVCYDDLTFMKLMAIYGWKYHSVAASGESIITFSKWPIIRSAFSKLTLKKNSKDAILYTQVAKRDSELDTFNELYELSIDVGRYITSLKLPQDEAVFVAGDMSPFTVDENLSDLAIFLTLMHLQPQPINIEAMKTMSKQNTLLKLLNLPSPQVKTFFALHPNHLQPLRVSSQSQRVIDVTKYEFCTSTFAAPRWYHPSDAYCSNSEIAIDLSIYEPLLLIIDI